MGYCSFNTNMVCSSNVDCGCDATRVRELLPKSAVSSSSSTKEEKSLSKESEDRRALIQSGEYMSTLSNVVKQRLLQQPTCNDGTYRLSCCDCTCNDMECEFDTVCASASVKEGRRRHLQVNCESFNKKNRCPTSDGTCAWQSGNCVTPATPNPTAFPTSQPTDAPVTDSPTKAPTLQPTNPRKLIFLHIIYHCS